MKNKRGFEFSFAWMFAIIVGMVIIFLAIYGVVRLVGTERTITDTEAAKELGILLNPVETSTGSARVSRIAFQRESRFYNECNEEGTFGSQGIGVATKSGIGAEWEDPGVISRFSNKYVFSSEIVQGDELITFSKPFRMPYEVADLIFIWSDQEYYCFVRPPLVIEEELEALRPRNINLSDSVADCLPNSKRVCFRSTGCDIDVSYTSRSLKKNFTTLYYEDSLVYGAIFSDPEVYECQVQRLMKRTSELAKLYAAKSQYVSSIGCSSNLQAELLTYSGALEINDSAQLRGINFLAENLDRRNNDLSCKVY